MMNADHILKNYYTGFLFCDVFFFKEKTGWGYAGAYAGIKKGEALPNRFYEVNIVLSKSI